MLQGELGELVTEHEALVKQGVDAEKERDALEALLDTLRERIEKLETRLSEERLAKVGNINANAVGADAARGAEATSMSVMRTEFKKLMREARAEHFRGLKVCLRACFLLVSAVLRLEVWMLTGE